MTLMDTSEGVGRLTQRWATKTLRFSRALSAMCIAPPGAAAYISVNAGWGMWLTTALVLAARLRKRRIALHHHTFAHVSRRVLRARVLARVAGKAAVHIGLTRDMSRSIEASYGVTQTVTVNNSGLVDPVAPPHDTAAQRFSIGFLSNLTAAKGTMRVVDLVRKFRETGHDVTLHIAGPVDDEAAGRAVEDAEREFGDSFKYWGRVTGDRKQEFFRSVDRFVFLSQYENEAAPLVLYEAMSANLPIFALRQGAIDEIVTDDVGKIADISGPWIEECCAWLETDTSRLKPQRAFNLCLQESYDAVDHLISFLASGTWNPDSRDVAHATGDLT